MKHFLEKTKAFALAVAAELWPQLEFVADIALLTAIVALAHQLAVGFIACLP